MPEGLKGFGNIPEFVKQPQALERACRISERIKIESFADLYGAETIKKDLAYVAKRNEQFHQDDFRNPENRVVKERAQIFESILFQEGDGAMWFGENSTIILPSEYDDIHHGVDSIVEIERQNGLSIAALSLDVTFRRDVYGKIEHIVEKLRKGHLTLIKYYQSVLGDMRGEVKNIPHFVVGADGGTLAQLINMFAEGKSEQFAKHPIQFQIIESVIIQSDVFAELGRKYGYPNIERAYERTGRIFREIYELRKAEIGDSNLRDGFYEHLKGALNRIE